MLVLKPNQLPQTLVMDLEGSDGRERGEDDTSFERQSALFALAAADVLLVNMWAKDIGRETGAGKPLLRTIFQVSRPSGCTTALSRHAVSRQRPVFTAQPVAPLLLRLLASTALEIPHPLSDR